MIFIISGLELWCISMTVLDCNMEKVLLQQKSHFIFLSSVMQLNSLWSEGYRPYLIPELLGLCSTETSEQTRFGCLLFSALHLSSLHIPSPPSSSEGLFLLMYLFLFFETAISEGGYSGTQSHMLSLTYINTVLGDSLS